MKRQDNRSDCPVNFGVEVLGDSWSLLILRDMMTAGKQTFGEFLDSDERIGASVLATRLAALEAKGIVTRSADEADGRKVIYTLTRAGRDILPIIYEFTVWGTSTNPDTNSHPAWYEAMTIPRETVMRAWSEAVEAGDSFYFGDHSVVRQLGLSDSGLS